MIDILLEPSCRDDGGHCDCWPEDFCCYCGEQDDGESDDEGDDDY